MAVCPIQNAIQGGLIKAPIHRIFCWFPCLHDFLLKDGRLTVDGRNPTPPGMYKTPENNGIFTISTGAEFPPSTVWMTHQNTSSTSGCRSQPPLEGMIEAKLPCSFIQLHNKTRPAQLKTCPIYYTPEILHRYQKLPCLKEIYIFQTTIAGIYVRFPGCPPLFPCPGLTLPQQYKLPQQCPSCPSEKKRGRIKIHQVHHVNHVHLFKCLYSTPICCPNFPNRRFIVEWIV